MEELHPRQQVPEPGFFTVARQGDVTGDGVPDNVLLVANLPDPESPFLTNITLIVIDGATGETVQVPLEEGSGFEPSLFLGDFTGDRVSDVLVQINSGGSGGFIFAYVYSFLSGEPRKLFDHEQFSESSQFDVIFRDDYRVDVIDRETGTVFTIDISRRSQEYLSEIYDEEGNLLEPLEGDVLALGGLWPVVTDPSGVFRLLAIQRIIGRFNADTLGFVQTLLRWNGSEFQREDVQVCVPGLRESEQL